MSDIIITSDSTCDLSTEQIVQNHIHIMSLSVILGAETFRDGVNITPNDIFQYVEKTGELPKTAAPSVEEYADFFRPFVESGKTVIHFNISSKSSGSHGFAKTASEEFPAGTVWVIDSHALSSGQGLLILKACDMLKEGKSAQEIYDGIMAVRDKVNLSFIPDTLDYLYKGGRCSSLSYYGAKVLSVHPMIDNKDGQLYPKKKYMGKMSRCIRNYINDLAAQYPNYDKKRCFITHSSADAELVELAKNLVDELFDFDEVIETIAGSIITCHCGRNTLGVLFITE